MSLDAIYSGLALALIAAVGTPLACIIFFWGFVAAVKLFRLFFWTVELFTTSIYEKWN